MTAGVALFRARTDATASAAQLRKFGFSVVSLPVFEIRPVAVRPKRARYDAVIATSHAAFLGEGPSDTSSPLFVVGERAGRAAKARGWRLASPSAPDAAKLTETLRGSLKPGASLLYLAGRDRKATIEAALGGAFALEVVEAYAAEARDRWRPAEARTLASCDAALHYSRRSAELTLELAQRAGAEARFLELAHVCLSRDVAEPLAAAGAARIAIADSPDEAGLFRALRRAFSGFPSHGASRI